MLIGTDYYAAEKSVQEIMLACAKAHPQVIQDDADRRIQACLHEFTDERIIYELVFWTHEKFGADTVRSDLRFAIREQLQAAGIFMAKRD